MRAAQYARCTHQLERELQAALAERRDPDATEGVFDQALANGLAAIVHDEWPGEVDDPRGGVKSPRALLAVIAQHAPPGTDGVSRLVPRDGTPHTEVCVDSDALTAGLDATQPTRHGRHLAPGLTLPVVRALTALDRHPALQVLDKDGVRSTQTSAEAMQHLTTAATQGARAAAGRLRGRSELHAPSGVVVWVGVGVAPALTEGDVRGQLLSRAFEEEAVRVMQEVLGVPPEPQTEPDVHQHPDGQEVWLRSVLHPLAATPSSWAVSATSDASVGVLWCYHSEVLIPWTVREKVSRAWRAGSRLSVALGGRDPAHIALFTVGQDRAGDPAPWVGTVHCIDRAGGLDGPTDADLAWVGRELVRHRGERVYEDDA